MAARAARRKSAEAPRTAAEAALRELIRTLGLLERVMQPYFATFGVSGAQWGVLRTLQRAEADGLPALRLTDLSDRLLVRPPSVTGVVDRLERAGLVRRDGSPTDLRTKRVALTPAGRDLVRRILAVHGRKIESVLAGLSAGEQDQLGQLLRRLGGHLEGMLGRQEAGRAG